MKTPLQSAQEAQRAGAKNGDSSRVDAPVSNASAAVPSPTAAPASFDVMICPQCRRFVAGNILLLDRCVPGTRVAVAETPCDVCALTAHLPAGCPSRADMAMAALALDSLPAPAEKHFVTLCMGCGDVKDGEIWRTLADYEAECLRTDLNTDITNSVCPNCAGAYRTQLHQLAQHS
jgi:hypothetical protein